MKVIAINGSPKAEGNTYHGLKIVTDELEKEGISTEIIHIGNKNIRGCIACGGCAKNKDEKCVINDEVNEIIQKIIGQDGLNNSKLPKGLLLFHKNKNEVRTATEEHMVEGLLYAASKDCLYLHFTISNDFESDFK